MVGDPDAELAAVQAMVTDWEHSGRQQLAEVQELTGRIAGLSATETSADGVVTVTVGSNGLPTDITLADAAGQQSMSVVSATIMATLRRAQSRIPELMARTAEDLGLAGDGVVAHMLRTAAESFPDEPDEPGVDGPRRPPGPDDYSDSDPLRDRW
ncbi:YbaB/EbfC family nucleoid-associated protein [Actinokineospora enzanensis]|uniref:YbaB/EbfC family nucleoid-associated protein n=1 Tax=Actinokineospora enzanensis TaxID=155975 RepID=UPI00037480A0|nr:YbaB/EbfC family nucleoid-associated protein [Actinokineospora enzanensis]